VLLSVEVMQKFANGTAPEQLLFRPNPGQITSSLARFAPDRKCLIIP
jgi:hypothetical protein